MVAVTSDAFGVETTSPLAADGSTVDVSPYANLRIRFNRFLADDTVSRASFCVQASTNAVERPDKCTEGRQFVEPAYDPVHQTVTLRLDPALGPEWAVQTRHTLSIFVPPADPSEIGDFGFRAFDDAALAAPFTLQFATGVEPATPPVAPTRTSREAYCLSQLCMTEIAQGGTPTIADPGCVAACAAGDIACFSGCCIHVRGAASFHLSGCAFSSCHASGTDIDGAPLGPAMGLDLSGPDGIRLTALGKTAHQTQVGEQADNADQAPRRFGRAMPVVDPGSPGNSYLLYKLLATPNYAVSPASPGIAEQARLRETVVVGMPMPALPPPLDESALDAVSRWVTAGAPVERCF